MAGSEQVTVHIDSADRAAVYHVVGCRSRSSPSTRVWAKVHPKVPPRWQEQLKRCSGDPRGGDAPMAPHQLSGQLTDAQWWCVSAEVDSAGRDVEKLPRAEGPGRAG